MAIIGDDALPALYDLAIDGVGYMVGWEVDRELLSPWKTAYDITEDDILVERRDFNANEMTENKLDLLYWKSQRSWDYGAGQQRYEVNLPNFPSERAFLDSKGIDVFSTIGQATLLPSTTNVLPLSNQGPMNPQVMVASDSAVYVAAPTPNVKRFSSVNAADAVTVPSGTTTNQPVFDMASDGHLCYLALGPDGVTTDNGIAFTVEESFDSAAGFTPSTGSSVSADTTDFVQGTGSLAVTTTADAAGPTTQTKSFASSMNFANVQQFKLAYKNLSSAPGNFIGSASTTNGGVSSTQTVLGIPTGVVANETIIVAITVWAVNGTTAAGNLALSDSSGSPWTSLGVFTSNNSQYAAALFTRKAVANDSGNLVSITTNASVYWNVGLMVFAGTIDAVGTWQNSQAGQPITNTGVTTTQPNETLVWIASQVLGPTASMAPAGWNDPIESTQTAISDKLSMAWLPQASAGPSGTITSANPSQPNNNIYNPFSIVLSVTPGTGTSGLTYRLQTSAGNYFERQLASAFGAWTTDVASLAQFTTVGSPSWASINQLVLTETANPSVAATFKFDDFEASFPNSFTAFSSIDCRVIDWVKDGLYGAGHVGGSTTQWQCFNVGSGSTSVVKYIFPDGFAVTEISELAGFIYITANRASRSQIYAWDGTNAPFVAVAMPPGEQALGLVPFLGAGFLIGARRLGSNSASTSGLGVLYRAFPQGNGTLTLERIATFGADDGTDYGIQEGTSYLDQVYMGRPNADASSTGLVAYFPSTGGYARHLEANAQGPIAGVTVFKNRRFFSVDGVGVFAEQGTYLPSGSITSSVIDWNIDKAKMILSGELGTLPLPAGTSVSLDWSSDGGVTFSNVTSESTAGASYATAPVRLSANIAVTRTTLVSDTTRTLTPTLKKSGLGAIYGVKPRRIYRIAIKAYARMRLKNGMDHPNSGQGLAELVESQLTALRDSQRIVQFQPSGTGEGVTEVLNVRVATLKVFRQYSPQVGWANLVQTTLYEVP